MAKPSFFTWSDYRSAVQRLTVLPPGVSGGVLSGLFLVQIAVTLLCWSLVWLPEAPWSKDWWLAAAALILPLAVALQMFTLLSIRRLWGDGLATDGRVLGKLLRSWWSLTAVLVLQGIVFLSPTWLPAFAIGVWDGVTNVAASSPSSATAVLAPWKPLIDVVQSLLVSLLGAFYLWTYPAAVFALDTRPREVHRWARTLAGKTWPLAVGFAVLSLGNLVWDRSGSVYLIWMLLQAAAAQAFVAAQTILLAEKTGRTGPLV